MRVAAALKFSADCRLCPRLARHLDEVRRNHPGYHARPVAPFGAARAKLVVVGLAPGMHGANRTGRPFTGDYAGILLHDTLHRFGFANRPVSIARGDGLRLVGCRITNAVKCLAPGFTLHDSYHCSRYNTQTKRLTPAMFRAVFSQIVKHLNATKTTETSLYTPGV